MANETVTTSITKRGVIIVAAIVLGGLSIAYHTTLSGWLCESAWFHSTLIDGPALALVILAWRELGHSEEANEHRKAMSEDLNGTKIELGKQTEEAKKANELREKNNELGRKNAELSEKLAGIQQQIADNLKRTPTKAARNAATLGKYMRKLAAVSKQETANLAMPYELVEMKDDVLTLFSPAANGASAIYRRVDCEDLTIDENPHGGCAVRLNVTKYQGQAVDLGQVTKWEDRLGVAPLFQKAPAAAWNASYGKGGSAEVKTLHIFQASDGSNSFQLESSDGSTSVGDNVQVSKCFMAAQIEYFAANFTRGNFGSGAINGGHRLFVC
jgi:hypothetical protein